jgi:hypothetical protein
MLLISVYIFMYIIDRFVVSIEYELIIEIIITFVGIEQDRSTTFHMVNLKGSHALRDIPFGQRVVAKYNKSWQLVGMYALKLRRMTCSIIKSENLVKL